MCPLVYMEIGRSKPLSKGLEQLSLVNSIHAHRMANPFRSDGTDTAVTDITTTDSSAATDNFKRGVVGG